LREMESELKKRECALDVRLKVYIFKSALFSGLI
jgi:hypothetical protein